MKFLDELEKLVAVNDFVENSLGIFQNKFFEVLCWAILVSILHTFCGSNLPFHRSICYRNSSFRKPKSIMPNFSGTIEGVIWSINVPAVTGSTFIHR